jgi:deoxyribose-phosphate aldolase
MQFAEATEQGKGIAPFIDHTLLKPDVTQQQILLHCREAGYYRFASVCITPCMVPVAASELTGSPVKVCVPVGFPMGASTTETKVFEATDAVHNGAREIDMVLNISALKDNRDDYILNDIRSVVKATADHTVKVILETALLSDPEIVRACRLTIEAGAHFVKTSTGTAGGATVEHIRLMRQTVGNDFGVKASGGIRSSTDALRMIKAGATRIGTSAGVPIVTS